MDGSILGGCLCGGVRYAYAGELGPASYCHCADCRRCTGSAFNVSVRLAAGSFRITVGRPRGFSKMGDSGELLTRYFCPDCGSPIYTSSPRHDMFVHVNAGSLDDSTWVKPHYQTWTKSAVAWAQIDKELSAFERDRE